VRGIIWPLATTGKSRELLAPDHEGLWRCSRRHRQAGRAIESDAFWALPLPPTTDFASLKRKLFGPLLYSAIPTELAYGISKSQLQMLVGYGKKGPQKSFGGLGADASQCRQLD